MFIEAISLTRPLVSYARLLASHSGFFWLDSTSPRDAHGRWSYMGVQPVEIVHAGLDRRALERALTRLGQERPLRAEFDFPRWVGYLSYDAHFALGGSTRQRHLRNPRSEELSFALYDAVLAVDHHNGKAWVCGESSSACAKLRKVLEASSSGAQAECKVGAVTHPSASDYHYALSLAKSAIACGDVYQINLAHRWSASFAGHPMAFWEGMRQRSPVPLGAYIQTAQRTVLSSSMELFLKWNRESARLITEPIKGTAPSAEVADIAALRDDAKEQAEHLMIVDLMRNDLGRVAKSGTVRVEKFMDIRAYRGLAHMVSEITCQTEPSLDVHTLLRATFPPGSISGAPKCAALTLIEALETIPRGPYTGIIGYLSVRGDLCFSVAIRTAIIEHGSIHYSAGGGIVEASEAHRELEETKLKAQVFLRTCAALKARRVGLDNIPASVLAAK